MGHAEPFPLPAAAIPSAPSGRLVPRTREDRFVRGTLRPTAAEAAKPSSTSSAAISGGAVGPEHDEERPRHLERTTHLPESADGPPAVTSPLRVSVGHPWTDLPGTTAWGSAARRLVDRRPHTRAPRVGPRCGSPRRRGSGRAIFCTEPAVRGARVGRRPVRRAIQSITGSGRAPRAPRESGRCFWRRRHSSRPEWSTWGGEARWSVRDGRGTGAVSEALRGNDGRRARPVHARAGVTRR